MGEGWPPRGNRRTHRRPRLRPGADANRISVWVDQPRRCVRWFGGAIAISRGSRCCLSCLACRRTPRRDASETRTANGLLRKNLLEIRGGGVVPGGGRPFLRRPPNRPVVRRPDSSPCGASRLRDSAGFTPDFAGRRTTVVADCGAMVGTSWAGPGIQVTDIRCPAGRIVPGSSVPAGCCPRPGRRILHCPMSRSLRIALFALLAAAGIAVARRWKTEAAPRMRGSWTPL
jgi:hypothetical protein